MKTTISADLSDRLDAVSAEISLIETLIGAAKSLELDGHEIFGLFSLLGGWRRKIDDIANQPSADEPAQAPAPAPEPTAAVPPLTEQQLCLITLLKESMDRGTQEDAG